MARRSLLCAGLHAAASALDAGSAGLASVARTARFARGRRAFAPRDDDVFVASYPRSGTTVTQLVAYLLTSGAGLDFDHVSQVSPWWERSLAHRDGAAADFELLPSPRVFKTHLLPRWLPARGRFIYLTRDGRDVAVSYYHLYRSHIGFEGSFASFWRRFLTGRLQYGSWFDHVQQWREPGERRVMWLRYRDLRSSLGPQITRIARFLELDVSAARIDSIAALASFESMKANEDRFDHAGEILFQRGVVRGHFIRRGAIGEQREVLDETQRAEFDRAMAHPHHLDVAPRSPRRPRKRRFATWRVHEFLR